MFTTSSNLLGFKGLGCSNKIMDMFLHFYGILNGFCNCSITCGSQTFVQMANLAFARNPVLESSRKGGILENTAGRINLVNDHY